MSDLLLHSTVGSTAATMTIGGAVAATIFAAASAFLDDWVLLSAAAAAAGRCQTARSCSRRRAQWLRRRSSAPCAMVIFGRLRRVARALSGGSGGAARLACSPGGLRRVHVKKCWLHSAFSRVVRLPERMPCVSLMPLTFLYKRVCVV